MHFPRFSLRNVNNVLTVAVALLAIYIIAAPYLPQLDWWLKHDSPVKAIVHPKSSQTLPVAAKQIVEEDKLFIPGIEITETVHGGNKTALRKGAWKLPHTSTPDKGGNTVLVGHRFTYKNPKGVFYHLDKVQTGARITLHWQGRVYEYEVAETKVVPASEVSVEDNTKDPRLTIYTCTPLWSVENRLVIIAKPLEDTQ